MANSTYLPTASRFDRMLSRHLANHVVSGVNCSEPVVRECYVQTREDLQLASRTLNDPYVREVESFLLDNVVGLMQTHQRFLAVMPVAIAATFITELLLDKPW